MTFQKVTSSQPVVEYLVGVLTEKLATGQKVLWLVPGGSAIGVAAEVSQQLRGLDAPEVIDGEADDFHAFPSRSCRALGRGSVARGGAIFLYMVGNARCSSRRSVKPVIPPSL